MRLANLPGALHLPQHVLAATGEKLIIVSRCERYSRNAALASTSPFSSGTASKSGHPAGPGRLERENIAYYLRVHINDESLVTDELVDYAHRANT